MQRIVYKTATGVAVVIPTGEIPLEAVIAKDVPKGAEYKVVDTAEIPSDRTFRNAWEIADGKIAVNMTKAIAIQQDRIRGERQPMLESLDLEYMKALETGDTKRQAEIVAEKQILRDAPASPLLTEAKTPDELKAVTVGGIRETLLNIVVEDKG